MDCKWVYYFKMKNGKKIFKARLMARGFIIRGNEETFFPVMKYPTL